MAIVPMINVAFLLLVFFLMSAVFELNAPLDVDLPTADGLPGGEGILIVVDDSGNVAREGLRGQAAFSNLVGEVVRLRVDASLMGKDLAGILRNLSEAGVAKVEIATRQP